MSPTPLPHAPRRRTTPPSPRPRGRRPCPFLALLGSGRHLLEAGCGAGEDLRLFRQQGLTVTAFDASRAQAAAASRLCGQPVRVCRFEQMQSVVPYDGIWASGSSLSARTRDSPGARSSGHPAQGRGPSTPPSPREGEPLPRSGNIACRPGSTRRGCDA